MAWGAALRFAPGALRQSRSYAAPPPPRLRLCQGRAARPRAPAVNRHTQSTGAPLSPVGGTALFVALASLSGASATVRVADTWPSLYTKVRVCAPAASVLR